MKKKILTILISCILILSLASCSNEIININVENSDALNDTVIGIDALIEIGDCLYYDSTTRIVYWWNGDIYDQCATTPSPYYAPNGLPYRYNPETNTLEQINNIEQP